MQVTTGDVTSVGSVFLANYAKVAGNLVSEGNATLQAGASVTGTTQLQTSIPDGVEVSWEPPVGANAANPQNVWANSTIVLAPGSYGKLAVYTGGRVKLSSGSYAFTDLQLEPGSTVELLVDPSSGPVVLYTGTVSAFRGTVTAGAQDAAKSLLLVQLNPGTLRLERSARMAIVAPQATVELGTGGTPHAGSIYAQGIHLEPDVTFTYVPFEYWSWLLPPKPIANCVYSAGRGSFVATFGYSNTSPTVANIPLGPSNFLTPAPVSSVAVPTTFQLGNVAEALWVPVDENGVSWTILGRTATVNLDSPQCQFPSGNPTAGPETTTEGRPLPRPSIPSVPAPRKVALALENASGPGYFQITQGQTPSNGVGDPNLPAEPGIPPNVPDGFTTNGTVPLTLRVVTSLPGEGFPEGNDLRGWSTLGGLFQNWEPIATPTNVGYYSRVEPVAATGTVAVSFQQVEYNVFSDHESVKADLVVDMDSRTFSGTVESAVINKSWIVGTPIVIDSYNVLSTTPISGSLGIPISSPFHGSNTALWTLNAPDLSGTVRVCANWTGYFVDEEVPGAPPEDYLGRKLDGNLRVRGYRASFAHYYLAVKGAFASFRGTGRLDEDGCIPDLPRAAFAYDDSVKDGGFRGVSLYMTLRADLVVDTPDGPAEFPIKDVANNGFIEKRLHFTAFDDDIAWPLENGIRIPPDEVELARPWRDRDSTVAASISHFLRRLRQLEAPLPAGVFPVSVGDGAEAGTFDFQGNPVPDSVASGTGLSIGPAFFPCSSTPTSSTECRKPCLSDDACAGGQHCAKESDAGDGCEGGSCFCAWADQGTMKYVTAHEFGHVMQDALTGGVPVAGTYGFHCQEDPAMPGKCIPGLGSLDDTSFSAFPNRLVDPPLMDESCGCQHVKAANALHCLQSIERVSRADKEGFGQFFASLMFNDPVSGSCRFNYYKEVLDVGAGACRVSGDPEACEDYVMRNGNPASVTLPPVPFDCGAPAKWRNQNSCAVSDQLEDIEKPSMGTEYDWMTFLYAVNRQVGLSDLMSIYNHACHPEYGGVSAGLAEVACGELSPDDGDPLTSEAAKPIAWVDSELNGSYTFDPVTGLPVIDPATGLPLVGNTDEHGGFLSGAQRKWGALSPESGVVADLGLEHGVSENINP